MNDLAVFEISSGLDQNLPVHSKELFNRIDGIIENAFSAEDFSGVWKGIRGLLEASKLSGIGLCKFYYDAFQIWKRLGLGDEDEFCDDAYSNTGRSKQTIKNYMSIWTLFEDCIVPKEYRESIISHGVKMLVPIANANRQGHEFPSDKWKEIAHAADESEVRKIVKTVTKQPARSNATQREIGRNGDISVWKGGKKYFIGYLARSDKDPIVKAEVERAISLLGLMEK